MTQHVISFDEGVEILRGSTAALEIHARRTRLALASMPDPYAPAMNDQDLEVAEDLRRIDALGEAGFGFEQARRILEPDLT
jgi:hypothetical protein